MGRMPDTINSSGAIAHDMQVDRLAYSTTPNVKGTAGAVARIRELFGIEVTEYYIRTNVTKRRLSRHEICHNIYFSDRDLFDFIVLNTRKSDAKGA